MRGCGDAGFRLNRPLTNPELILPYSLETFKQVSWSLRMGKRKGLSPFAGEGAALSHSEWQSLALYIYVSIVLSSRHTSAQYLVSAGQNALYSPAFPDNIKFPLNMV